MSIGAYTLSWRALAASAATAGMFLFVAAAAWGETTYTPVGSYKCQKGYVVSVGISPDGKFVAYSCYDDSSKTGHLEIYKVENGIPAPDQAPHKIIDMGATKYEIHVKINDVEFVECINKKGQKVWCVSVYDAGANKIVKLDPETGEVIDQASEGGNPTSQEGVPNPAVVVGGPASTSPSVTPPAANVVEGPRVKGVGTIIFLDENGKPIGAPVPLYRSPWLNPVQDIAWAPPDGGYVAVVGKDRFLCLVQATGAHVCKRIPLASPGAKTEGTTVDVSTGGLVGVGTSDGKVIVVSPGPKKNEIVTLEDRDTVITCVEFDSDGNLIAGGKDGIVKIWDPVSKTCIATIDRGSSVSDIATGPGGTVLVGGADGEVKVYQPTVTPKPNETTPKTGDTFEPEVVDPIVATPTPTPDPMGPNATVVNAWPYPQP